MVNSPEVAIKQPELILHLYELRREAVMRSARSYIEAVVEGSEIPPRRHEEKSDAIAESRQPRE